MSNMICFQDVSLVYESKKSTVKITDNLNISLRVNDFTCILGPSGCGKTTLLNVIAGFQFPSSGKIIIGSASRNKFNPNISYVFQGHNIFPWKTVKQNIAFGLGSSRIDDSLADRIDELASKMGLAEYLDSYPDTLSGGLKQRVGVARALISSPDVLLMDEPFASIDELTAHSLRTLLKDLYKEKPIPDDPANISTATNANRPVETAILRPLIICGNAQGNHTCITLRRPLIPKIREAWIYSFGTCLIPAWVFNQTGNMHAQATRLILPSLPRPKSTSINGTSATEGIERK